MAEGLAGVGIGWECQVLVMPAFTLRVRIVARPGDAACFRELLVGQSGVVAGASCRTVFPGFEGLLWRAPFDQRFTRLVAEIHAGGEIEKNVEVGFGFARRIYRLVRDVHGAVN